MTNPRILYTGDNEGPAVMRLETLIRNFNETGGWQFRHNESDMRYELDSRGYYSGLHDNGHYLAVNIDRLMLEPAPALYDKAGAVAADLGGTVASKPTPIAPAVARGTFWERFDAMSATVLKTAPGAFMAGHGYGIFHTGGGCMAWSKDRADSKWSVWICDDGNGLGEELGDGFQTERIFGCAVCNSDGDYVSGPQCTTVAECLEWGGNVLFADNAERLHAAENCPGHRDNGRGICCDCGHVL